MSTNQKILDILIESMGAEAILAICQERISASKTSVMDTPPPAAAKSPVVVKAPVKVIVKKPAVVAPPTSTPAKNLSADFAAAAKETWTCPPCGKGPGNDHRTCVVDGFGCDVEAWETAVGLRKENKVVVVKKASGAAPAPAPAITASPSTTTVTPAPSETKKAGRPKKPVTEVPRCDGRVYGEGVEMEGTKAPNGKPLHCYRHAQCERKGHEILAVPESGDLRHLKEGEEVAEDEGKVHLCKVCIKRWEARAEHPDNWHGFFDDDGAPETSHFINGAWYQKKMAAVKSTTTEGSD